MRRVLYATGYTPFPAFDVLRGGTMKTDRLIVDALAASGISLHILSCLGRSDHTSWPSNPIIPYEHLDSEPAMVARIRELAPAFDVVHISSRVIFNKEPLARDLRAVPRPIVYTLTGPMVLDGANPRSFDVCARIACLSTGLMITAGLRGLDSARMVVVGSVIDERSDRPADADHRAAARARLGIEGNALLYVAAGRISIEKRFDRLASLWRSRFAKPDALYVLGKPDRGDEPMERLFASLQDMRGDGIVAPGWVEIDPYLAAADFAVACSEIEGLSNVALEAAARGVPNIAPRQTPGYADIIDDASGILYDRDDDEALLSALDRARDIRRHPAAYEKMSNAARAAVAHFSPARIAGRYRELYEEVLV